MGHVVKFPTLRAVTTALLGVRAEARQDREEEYDVRLQVTERGWQVHVGSSDYDLDHHGVWGASTVGQLDPVGELRETARSLLEQCREAYASRWGCDG